VVLLVFSLGFGSLGVGTIVNPAPLHASPPKEKLSKEERRRQKAIQKEMESPYKKWLDEEVPYIITAEERASFKKLSTDDEREQWRYRYIDGIGTNIILEFVDPTMTGEYRLTIDPGEKDALLHVPNAGLTQLEAMGMSSKADRFTRTDGMTLGRALGGTPESMNEFTRLDLYSKIFRPPEVKFKDLKAVVTSRLSTQLLPFDVRTDYIRVTDESVLTPITIQVANRDLQFQNKDGVMHGVLDIFAQITTPSGRYVNTIEESVVLDVPEHDFQTYVTHRSVYQKAVPLRPGLYKLSVVVKDDLNGQMGSMEQGIRVPRFGDAKLSRSSLLLAD